ncbi:glycerol-3-phosphate dehydrogenase SDP6, mitochondrial [Tanacetum coccineum]
MSNMKLKESGQKSHSVLSVAWLTQWVHPASEMGIKLLLLMSLDPCLLSCVHLEILIRLRVKGMGSGSFKEILACRLGAIVVDVDLTNGTQVAWTETFLLHDHCSTYLKKHHIPFLTDKTSHLQAEFYTYGKVVVNAGGPFCDSVRNLTDIDAKLMICPSSGVHIVLPDYYSPKEWA